MVHRHLTPLVNRYVAPLNISCCYYQTRPDEGVSSFFNTSTHTRGFSTSNTPASTSRLRIYLLRFRCSITWIHRYVLNTQVCVLTFYPRFQHVSRHFNPRTPHSLSISVLKSVHACRPTLLHLAHIQISPHITIPLFDESLLMTSCLLLHRIIFHHLS